MSTKPGVTIWPLASISSRPEPAIFPTSAMRPSRTATSASRGAEPVPSITDPLRTTRSKAWAMSIPEVAARQALTGAPESQ
jgi:hypothetical protein